MNRKRAAILALIMSSSVLTANAAWADRGWGPRGHWQPPAVHHHHGHGAAIGIGAGLLLGSALLWAASRPPVVVAEPTPVVVSPPPVVVAPAPVEPAVSVWYYCRPAGAYYPYVSSCPTAWETVPARPY